MKIKIITLLALFICCFSSCSDDDPVIGPDNPDGPFKKTVLLYMVAENNLSSAGYNNINNMLKGSTTSNLKDNNVLIYFDPVDDTTNPEDEKYDPDKGKPIFLQLRLNNYSEVVLDTIQRFEEHNSASVEVLSQMISKMTEYKSDSYDLILWGHATNWLPTDFKSKFSSTISQRNDPLREVDETPGISLYSYGDDNGEFLEIDELAAAIPDHLFDMILFDACYMASVEVAYELRNKAKHFIAAASEIISYGFPYNRVMDYLLGSGSEADYRMICQEYFDYYNSMSGQYRSATISWTRLDRMDVLASAVGEILKNNREEAGKTLSSTVQNFDRTTGYRVMRDLGHYIETIAPAEYETFQSVLEEVIPLEKHTDIFITYDINRHCGLTIYPYYATNYNYVINEDYENLGWYKAVYE